jgi:uncharacterized protein YqeY
MNLIETIEADLIKALKSHLSEEVSTLRLLKNAIDTAQKNTTKTFEDSDIITIIKKQAKDRKEAISIYLKAEKEEMAKKEQFELDLLNKYLPEEMSQAEIEPIINKIIDEMKPSGLADFGKVMGAAMAQLKDKVDGNKIAEIIKKKLV